jgi:hypothetical protein
MSRQTFELRIINVRCVDETEHEGVFPFEGEGIANDAMRLKALFMTEDSNAQLTELRTPMFDLGSNYQDGTTIGMELRVGTVDVLAAQTFPVAVNVALFLIEEDYFGDISGIEGAISGYAEAAKVTHGLLSTIVGLFPGASSKIASGIGKIASVVEPLIAGLVLSGGNDLFPPQDISLLLPSFDVTLAPTDVRGIIDFVGHGGHYQLTYEWHVRRHDAIGPSGTAPLDLYWSASRGDNFSTATAAGRSSARSAGYVHARTEGYLFDRHLSGTIPLDLYWNSTRGDNFTTANATGRTDALNAAYAAVRTEGYLYSTQQPGTVPLKQYWNAVRGDNFTTASTFGERDALTSGYTYVRVEGYLFPRAIALRADNGQYLGAEGGGGSSIDARRPHIREHEIFEVVYLDGDRIALRTYNGYYLCAEGGGGREVVANRTWIGDWEQFTWVHVGGSRIALRVHNGQLVCAEGGGGHEVVANRTRVDRWETFEIIAV